jgi:hypothetical protein
MCFQNGAASKWGVATISRWSRGNDADRAHFAGGAGWHPTRERGTQIAVGARDEGHSHAANRPTELGSVPKIICWKTRTGPPGLTPLWARDQSVSWGAGEAVRFG